MSRLIGLLVVIWLVVGALAGLQRGYYKGDNDSCARFGTIVVTIVAGPLNYLDVNPKVHDCKMPQPSK